MPVIKFNGQQFALQPGQNRLGGGTTADVALNGAQGVLAIVDLGADGRATIRKAGTEGIKVNGTAADQPTPLIHGDKVEISGNELFFADDVKQGGSTQFVSAADVAAIAAKRSGPARGTLNTGGRLVSLVDGKEYPIPEAGVTIGRDASADIVVAQTAVSRRHAQVIPSGTGYVVNDLSTNGVFVNGEKAPSGQVLSRADVIRVGTEEFRFYADLAPMGKAPAPAPTAAAPTPAPAAPKPAAPVGGEATGRVPTLPPPGPAAAPPPPKPAAPPAAAPAAAKPAAAKAPTPPARPATPAPAPVAASAPVTTKKGVPAWLGIVIVLVVAAVAAYFILVSKN